MTVYSSERHCLNCRQHEYCWTDIDFAHLEAVAPRRFQIRADTWTRERFIEHMKNIYGQICGHYEPNQATISNRRIGPIMNFTDTREGLETMRALERMNSTTEDREWDNEENR